MRYFFSCLLIFFVSIFGFSQTAGNNDSIKKEKKVRLVGIPLINYSNSFGASFGAFGSGFYRFKQKDTISPLSTSSLISTYSTNDTWFAGQINKFYLKEDKLRIKVGFGLGSVNFQTYVAWPGLPDIPPIIPPEQISEGNFVDYNTTFQFAVVEVLKSVRKNLYVGGRIVYSHSKTEFESELIPKEELNQFGFGLSTELDSRNSQFAPTKGKHSNIKTLSFFEGIGSTNSYTRINLVYNHYFPIKERNTLLARFYSDISVGDVPFAGQNVVGRDDLRGYSNGKYRGEQVYAVQSEYRKWFREKWGYVAFGGLASAIDNSKDVNINNILPAAGVGIRFLAIPKANINIGMDVAVGKDDWGLYFRIGEAFTR